ncbi:hypothetical protein BB560_001917 [Smittium megazygosporum]|uniref:Uncharacterized protein n=1 Tax=Smittium megazygosporum TaxID=133381 RepID=A0A2T9ZFA1_9FUNG|nr:hypothetical protein BB560_002288 [Smittium megazygosporum]PVV03599.1 hypothetical protein BB560_001917 [Smittium megazygosporum]
MFKNPLGNSPLVSLEKVKSSKESQALELFKDSASLQVIVIDTESFSLDQVSELLLEFSKSPQIPVFCGKVPKHKPFTKAQFLEWKQYWPVSFHEEKSSVEFTQSDFAYIEECFSGIRVPQTNQQVVDESANIESPINETVASKNITKHAVMTGIDLVAKHTLSNTKVSESASETKKRPLADDDSVLYGSCPFSDKQAVLCSSRSNIWWNLQIQSKLAKQSEPQL